ncbi:MAG: hypothetical protein GY835_14215 [bacterium]|nr:hypothetical protein [bacterium]
MHPTKTTAGIFHYIMIALMLLTLSVSLLACKSSSDNNAAKQIQDYLPPATADMPLTESVVVCTTIDELRETHVNGGTSSFDFGYMEGVAPEYQGDGGTLNNVIIRITITRHSSTDFTDQAFTEYSNPLSSWTLSPDFDITAYTMSGIGNYRIIFTYDTYLVTLQITGFDNVNDAESKLDSFARHIQLEMTE